MTNSEEEPKSIERHLTRYTPDSWDALNEVAKTLGITPNEAANRAAVALKNIVNAGIGSENALIIVDAQTYEPLGEVVLFENQDLQTEPGSNILPFRSK